jgi:DNA modification methylase
MTKSKQIENTTVTSLIADDKNFNKGSEVGAEMIRKSFQKFGSGRSILIDKNNRIIAGNKSVEFSGLNDVMIVESDGTQLIAVKRTDIDLDTPEGREMALADNASAKANIVFDAELVEAELGEAVCVEWGIDVATKLEAEEDDFSVPDGGIETDIVLGDLFEIGEHRLLCGDSTDSDSVAKLMNGEKAEITFTSPPYNAGGNENIPNSGGLKYETYTDNKSEDEYFDFLCGNINAILPHTNEIFYNIGLIEKSKRSINKLLFQYNDIFKDIIYWNKSTVAPHIQPGIINNKIEFILCFGNGSRKFINAQFSQGTYWNVIEGPNASGNEFAKIHKATFPLYLPENIINNFSNVNAIVLDCFGGTGTTMVAAHQLKRKCYGMELDPKYCQVIIDRMKKLDPSLTIKRNGINIT